MHTNRVLDDTDSVTISIADDSAIWSARRFGVNLGSWEKWWE